MRPGRSVRSAPGAGFVPVALALPMALALLATACGGGEEAGSGGDEAPAGRQGGQARAGEARLPDDQLGSLERSKLGLSLPWTVGEVNRDPTAGSGTATVTSVELRTLPGADRFLITFESADAVPGYRVAGTIDPLVECATGDTIRVQNAGLLQIRLDDARTADSMTLPPVEGSGLENVLTATTACDSGGTVEWVLSVGSATFYRAVEASDPPRLAVDVQHPEEEGGGDGGG